ncbi:hypothetical protein G9464_14180 [Halostella sp. JP-L12]|uniref:VNG_1110C family protein n=1 Tax=Halostella TaxID=1843185 RepID=UPI000EF81B6D|nr:MULTISPECIES: hypothetical protein [Halostella]NHN48733.1 hypothetical protein [Halostella sp. JP-L12]
MPDPSRLRDSTQIVLPRDDLDGRAEDIKAELRERFVLTIYEEGECYRIIGSPVEIKEASKHLSRRGISLP